MLSVLLHRPIAFHIAGDRMLLLLSLLLAAVFTAGIPHNQRILPDTGAKKSNGIPGIDASYEYVVVGGGTAGVTVAARLAEKNFRVALVEAGDNYQHRSLTAFIPGADSLKVGASPAINSAIDWGFVARKVPGANYRDIHYARGKCLGGSYDITDTVAGILC